MLKTSKYADASAVSRSLIDEVVSMRKRRRTVTSISREVKLSFDDVKSILLENLGDDLEQYHPSRAFTFSQKKVDNIVRLRKEGKTLKEIVKVLRISTVTIRQILKDELKEAYDKYLVIRKPRKCLPEIDEQILQLKVSGIPVEDIARISGVPVSHVRKVINRSFEKIFDDRIEGLSGLRVENVDGLKEECAALVKEIHGKIKKHTKFRSLEKLVPVVLYLCLKRKGYEIKKSEMVFKANITKFELKNGVRLVLSHHSGLFRRNRERVVLDKISRLRAHFNLSDEFIDTAFELSRLFYERLKFATESVTTGIICTLALCKLGLDAPTYNRLCVFLKIRASSVLRQIQIKFFPNDDFKGVVTSREMIKSWLNSLSFPTRQPVS